METLIVMQALGRGLVLEPYLVDGGASARDCIATRGMRAAESQWLPAIAAGSKRFALATFEPEARFDLWHIRSRAERTRDGFVLNGRKSVVLHGDSADALIVSARTSGD